MLGRKHRIRVRLKITAASLLFDDAAPVEVEQQGAADSAARSAKRKTAQGA